MNSFDGLRRGVFSVAIAAAMAGAMIVPGSLSAQQEQIGIAVGEMPVAVQLEDLNGNEVSLEDYIGDKPVVIEFWATWCPVCERLKPQFDAVSAEYQGAVQILFVAVAVNQSQRRVRRFIEDNPHPGEMLWDGDGNAVRAFSAPSTSYVVVLDADGRVVYTGAGDSQDLVAALRGVMGQ
ncbi:MAG: TlpA family protein disulfide reductase [Gemmatimonadetes bacterium]|nr:TlpA family protein disulfide reductase [Gemmatimonadota bacterium]